MKQKREVPIPVKKRAIAAGILGIDWLANLNNIISQLEKQWKIKVGETLFGGSTAFVAHASDQQKNNYVIKVEMPDTVGQPDFSNTIKALELVNGNGYVKLFTHDNEKKASLLERLGEPLKETVIPIPEQINIICSTLQKTWSVSTYHSTLQSGIEIIPWFDEFVQSTWESLNRPCSEKTIEQAHFFLQSRQASENPENFVLIHGDAHNANILQDRVNENQFKLIDPDGIIYEKAYDLGVLMREWTEEYKHHPLAKGMERCEQLSLLTSVDKQAIWEWGFLQCVSTGLLLMSIDNDSGKELLTVAEAWTNSM